jgi:hypothetical protein
MTVQIAEAILLQVGVKVAYQHRFAFDTGTILRLENHAMVNIFDDGRYYLQGDNTPQISEAFSRAEIPWDPEKWDGEVPKPKPVIDLAPPTDPMHEPNRSRGNADERLDF